MNNILVCESCGTLYAACVYKDKECVCESMRRDRPGIDGRCGGTLTELGMHPHERSAVTETRV
jgi:hypothetical protein